MLTVQILTGNNADTIGACLESIAPLGCRVVVGDTGSEDGTREACERFGAEVRDVGDSSDMSAVRNSLCGEGRNMYIEPWERIVRGSDVIGGLSGSHAFYVIQEGMISKQVRLWDEGKFENPVFESVVGANSAVTPQVVLVGDGQPDMRRRNTAMCQVWADRRPTSPDPHYYLACCFLAEGRREEFAVEARKFLTMSSSGEASVMMKYYLSRVELSSGNLGSSFQGAIGCLAVRPSFAEFWCLLGDILFSQGEYNRSKAMYANARIAGRRRKSDDTFPMDIAKYDAYPRMMEEKCLKAMSKGKIVGLKMTQKG
jgi:hypothetical protein